LLQFGFSLRFYPGVFLPTIAHNFFFKKKQATPYDHHANVALTIRADVDYVFQKIMDSLDCVEEDWDKDLEKK
jgi:hypothetical protein